MPHSIRKLNVLFLLIILLIHVHSWAVDVKAIIFDCDGTLIDNCNGYYLNWQYALKLQNYELSNEEFWTFMDKNQLVGASCADAVIVKYCCELLGRDCAQELLIDKRAFMEKAQARNDFPLIQPTVLFLRQLAHEKERYGFKLALASGGAKQNILRVLNHFDLAKYFDLIISGSDDLKNYNDPEGTNKPKPYVYLEAAKLLNVLPEECLAIEDSYTGICSAKNAGCFIVAIPNLYTKNHDFSLADLKLISFEGINLEKFLQMILDR